MVEGNAVKPEKKGLPLGAKVILVLFILWFLFKLTMFFTPVYYTPPGQFTDAQLLTYIISWATELIHLIITAIAIALILSRKKWLPKAITVIGVIDIITYFAWAFSGYGGMRITVALSLIAIPVILWIIIIWYFNLRKKYFN